MKSNIIGLTSQQVLQARIDYGSNALKRKKRKSFVIKLIENLSDPIIRILLIATFLRIILSFGNCNWFEIGGILIAVLVSATVTALSEWGSEKAFEKMEGEEKKQKVCVLRDNTLKQIPASDLVVGDIVYIGVGEQISADGVLIDGEVSVNQAVLNGETIDVLKTEQDQNIKINDWNLDNSNQLFRGSIVTQGSGTMRVFRVGENTFYGGVAKGVQAETRESPLQMRLSKLAKQISRIGYLMAGIVALTHLFFILIVKNNFSVDEILIDIKNLPYLFSVLLHAFSLMITVVVVAVPEGLPMMITVVLSSNMKRMHKDGVIVKKMVGIETAGSLNILFTDKTGTLTKGNLSVCEFFTCNETFKSLEQLKNKSELYSALCLSSRYNSDCVFDSFEARLGNQTDRAIANYFIKEKICDVNLIEKTSFDSKNKYAKATVEFKNQKVVLLKGAPETVVQLCEASYDNKDFDKQRAIETYKEVAKKGKRVLAFAIKDHSAKNYNFLCFVSLSDDIRKGAKKSVTELQNAGVQIVMITGDGYETAQAIAKECSILKTISKNAIIEASVLRRYTDDEIKNILCDLRVVCRALPDDKMRLVKVCQECGYVVGMTGDGINDAPALKHADVGFAMGSGTDIAKSAADIVLTNDHISSIVQTVLYGRTIFRSIRKFVSFQLLMNFAACGISLIGQFIGIESPITIVQMLWVNLIMDTLGGLAFAGEPPNIYYMIEKPKKRDEPILTGKMISQIIITGSFSIFLCTQFLKGHILRNRFDYNVENLEFLTGFYALFIFIGIFNCIHTRSERLRLFHGIKDNRTFIIILSFITMIQIWIIYCGGTIFRSVPLSLGQLLSVIFLSLSVIPFEFLRRIMFKLYGK